MDVETRTLLAEIELGEVAHAFFKTEIGRFVVERSEREVASALEGLKKADPEDSWRIRELQTTIRVAEAIPLWLNELIIGGEQAAAALQESE